MKIQLPIDTSAVSFIDVMPPEPVLDGHTKQQKADANGEPLYSVELVCIGTEGDEILSVTFPGPPPAGIRQGVPVRVTGLMVTGGPSETASGSHSGPPTSSPCRPRTQRLA
ncbi:MAG: hypothetical protein QOH66_625, partial [Actinomycetota bacterium]|nr:hypothetical protein [Actinomycetota bacterium]